MKYVYKVFYTAGDYTTSSKQFDTELDAQAFANKVVSPSIMKSRVCKYGIDSLDIGMGYRTYFTNYVLTAYGDDLEELIEDACITEVDQDGDEIYTVSLLDVSNETYEAAMQVLTGLVKESV